MAKQVAEQNQNNELVKTFSDAELTLFAQNMDAFEPSNFEILSGSYIKFEQGVIYDCVALGLVSAPDYNDNSKTIENGAVELLMNNGQIMTNSDVVMLESMKRYVNSGKQFPIGLRVTNKGTRQNAKGKDYADLNILGLQLTEAGMNYAKSVSANRG